MISLLPEKKAGLKILCLGAHCDDIEIGCGGTILNLIKELSIGEIHWIVFTSTEERAAEAAKSADFFTKGVINKTIEVHEFKDGILPQQLIEAKALFEGIKQRVNPDIIFTHYRHDLHQDHRLINELTWNTFRNHFILEYEIQKYDGDLGNPGMFVPLEQDIAEMKVNALLAYFPSQAQKHWFDKETFFALLRIRGVESTARYAEAFYLRKSILLHSHQ